jgi:TRAP-type C4-dicarboxylate transport system permease small subunit
MNALGGQMPAWVRWFVRTIEEINKLFLLLASAGTVLIVCLVLVAVASRMTGEPLIWPYDIAQFTLVYVFFLGLAPALESGHHIGVELFDRFVPPVIRPAVAYIASTLIILFGAVLLFQLWRTTSRAFGDGRMSIQTIAIPLKWIYVIGPIGTIQFILTELSLLARHHWGEKKTTAPAH